MAKAKYLKRAFLILGLVITGLWATLYIINKLEMQGGRYASWHEAKQAEVIDKGWIPDIIPLSSFEIEDEHHNSSNTGQGEFRFNKADASTFKEKLSSDKVWDEIRRQKVDVQSYINNGYNLYHHEDFLIAVNWTDGHAVYWLELRR